MQEVREIEPSRAAYSACPVGGFAVVISAVVSNQSRPLLLAVQFM